MFTEEMSGLASVVLVAHFSLLVLLSLFGLHRLSMVLRWFRYRHVKPTLPGRFEALPKVTVQIPLYNERCVAERIIDAVAAFDYPKESLQIQIVDDSNDDTSTLIAKRVAYHQQQGVDIQHVQRDNRQGFKAGALKDAMESATGEFIAIFDADFIPPPHLLRETIDHFCDEKLAMVQFRWEHLNRYSSRLTQTQAMMLDAHFALEQQVRCASKMLFNFNGTAGIWRTEAIIDAGHWSADTLTEDLDLSYRAQMKGWKLLYLNDVSCPGELPADMNAFKSQQHRWAKGGVQVMLKMLASVWRAPVSLTLKIESTFHLSNNMAFLVMLADTIFLLIPSLLIREHYDLQQTAWVDLPLLLTSTGGHLAYFICGQAALKRSPWETLWNLPRLLLVGIQLAFNNATAAAEALRGKQSEFVRTPKSGDMSDTAPIATGLGLRLYRAVTPKGVGIECLLALIYSFVFYWAIDHELWLMLPFLLLLVLGFFTTAFYTLTHRLRLRT